MANPYTTISYQKAFQSTYSKYGQWVVYALSDQDAWVVGVHRGDDYSLQRVVSGQVIARSEQALLDVAENMIILLEEMMGK
jgi:hypothetical protein